MGFLQVSHIQNLITFLQIFIVFVSNRSSTKNVSFCKVGDFLKILYEKYGIGGEKLIIFG
jgi:hypothetical protein